MGPKLESYEINRVDTGYWKTEQEKKSSKRVKRRYIKLGYSHQLSIYGASLDKNTGKTEGLRIEVLSKELFSYMDFKYLFQYFYRWMPMMKYTIWTFDNKTGDLELVGQYT